MASAFVTAGKRRGEHASGEDYTPNVGASGVGERVTKVEPRAAFLYRAHPERWQVVGGRVLPLLGRMPLMPGLNNVELDERTGSLRVRAAKAAAEERGWTVIPTSTVVPGSGRSSYLYRPKGRPDVTLCIYELCFPGSSVTQADTAGWVAFLSHLVDSGIVEPSPLYVLDRMRASAISRLDRAINKVQRAPAAASQVERIKAEIEVIEAEIATRTVAVAPSLGEDLEVSIDGDEPALPAKPPAPPRRRKRTRK